VTTPFTARDIADQLAAARDAAEPDPTLLDRLMADDVTWELKGDGLEYARVYRGKAEVYGQYLGRLQQHLDPAATTITTVDVFVDDAQGAIVTHNADALVLSDGRTVDVEVVMIMRVADGLIRSVVEFMDLRPVEAAFGPSL
jgi:ketosteroid isomerase-like protein